MIRCRCRSCFQNDWFASGGHRSWLVGDGPKRGFDPTTIQTGGEWGVGISDTKTFSDYYAIRRGVNGCCLMIDFIVHRRSCRYRFAKKAVAWRSPTSSFFYFHFTVLRCLSTLALCFAMAAQKCGVYVLVAW
jgi:hypothetical protein